VLRYLTHITTDVGLDEAFFDLSHFDRAAEWDPGVAEGTMLTPEPVGRGSRFELSAKFFGRAVPMEYEIVEFEPGTRVVLQAETPFVRSIDTITFASVPSGSASDTSKPEATLVTYDARLEPKGAARFGTPLLALAFRRIGDRAAAGLRERLRSEPSR
jgi:hypothetical protein